MSKAAGKSGRSGNPSRKGRASEERRARIEAAKAAERARARRSKLIIGTVVGVVLVVVAVGVLFAVSQQQKHKADAAAALAAQDRAFIATATSLPASTYASVGLGSATAENPQRPDNPSYPVPVPISGGSAMTADGKPRVLYVGAEYCPFCAQERWSLVAALSRFGTWKGLAGAVSASNDTPANIPTFTLKDATYSSKYLSLTTYEVQDRDRRPLQQVSDADQSIVTKLNPSGGIPFIDYGGLYMQTASSYDGTFLANKKSSDVAFDLKTPTSKSAQAIVGGANVTTAQLCKLTKGQPSNVCTSPGVVAAAKVLK